MTLDPEAFRIKVGNYKDRWYIDPLPGCELADADSDWRAPAVSTIKKASSKDWTQVAIGRAAAAIFKQKPDFGEYQPDDIFSYLNQANANALDLASTRGIQIHKMFEVYAEGGNPADVELGFEAEAYRETVLRCIRRCRPAIMLSEFLCMSRTVGYGGTGDAIWTLQGWPDLADGAYLLDYKSRTEKHAVYIEEAWQVAAYAKADYFIVDAGHNTPVRFKPGEFRGGLILSITPTSFSFYPVDLEQAWPGFLTLRDHWQHRRNGKTPLFGEPVNPPRTRDSWIRERIDAIKAVDVDALKKVWPFEIPTPKKHPHPYSDVEVDALDPMLAFAEKHLSIPWGDADPAAPPHLRPHEVRHSHLGGLTEAEYDKLDEDPAGVDYAAVQEAVAAMSVEGELQPDQLTLIKVRFEKLRTPQREWINSVVVEANECDLPISLSDSPTQRRVAIAKVLIRCAENGITRPDINTAINAVSFLTIEALEAMPLGAAIGVFDYHEALALLEVIKLLPNNPGYPRPEPAEGTTVRRKGDAIEYAKRGTKEESKITDKLSPPEKPKPATTARPAKKAAAKKAATTTPKPTRKARTK